MVVHVLYRYIFLYYVTSGHKRTVLDSLSWKIMDTFKDVRVDKRWERTNSSSGDRT